MSSWMPIARAAVVSGSVAGIVSAAVLAAVGRQRTGSPARPINATSHWLHGDRAATVGAVDAKHTLVGFATHLASAIFWGLLFEVARARSAASDPVATARTAVLTAAAAAVVDYGVVPRRLTPGWELALPKRSVAVGLLALAAGLTAGGLLTDPRR